MIHLGTRDLFTYRCLLTQFTDEYIKDAYNNWCSDEDVTKYLTFPTHKNIDETSKIINNWIDQYKNIDFYQWAIIYRENKEAIGTISVVYSDDRIEMVRIGYALSKKYWGKGIMTACLSRVIQYFFKEVGVNRVELRHSVLNKASGKVIENCGLKYEGTLKDADYSNFGISDQNIYAITKLQYDDEIFYDIMNKENCIMDNNTIHHLKRHIYFYENNN